MNDNTSLDATRTLDTANGPVTICSLDAVAAAGLGDPSRLPVSIKVLLESALRNVDGFSVDVADVARIAAWDPADPSPSEIPFLPGRVVLQDFTGVPAVVDLAALRDACARLGGDPQKINPQVPCDLVIDHSVQVDYFGRADALRLNAKLEFDRNRERYEFLKWGQQAFQSFSVVPPATGIVHQVNLEYLAKVVMLRDGVAYPDSLVGTDSHTTMINGLGVVGWGVGGIEAEAVMLGQPISMLSPKVVGFRLDGRLPEGATATDLVLTVTQILRRAGVVGQFVEFYGPGLDHLSLPDRATISNMAPEYGATIGFFPVDDLTLDYLRLTGREPSTIDLVERYCKVQGLWCQQDTEPSFSRMMDLDLGSVVPSLAGPKRPQDRIALTAMQTQWRRDLSLTFGKASGAHDSAPSRLTSEGGPVPDPAGAAVAVATDPGIDGVEVTSDDRCFELRHGAVVIAAITSCTNTSNPSVMLGAGLVARKAIERGLTVKPWVKTSLAPGSRVVTEYLERSGLDAALDELGFQTVGYGCTTCIGNSGPLPAAISEAIREHDLVVASVLSGNRNFEGRVNPDTRANYLASPPLVVAYALAGTVDIDLSTDPIGVGGDGQPVFLSDIWPSQAEIREVVASAVGADQFRERYADVFTGAEEWQEVEVSGGQTYDWQADSTYIRHPPFFADTELEAIPLQSIRSARVLALLGDSVTTDHISPAGAIPQDSPAARYLRDHGVEPKDFNSYGSRRGNHEVMMRGTFGNIRLKNRLVPGTEGGVTEHLPTGETMSIYDAAMKYAYDSTPLVVIAGAEYGTGSSRDWAAKGTILLGVRAVIARSYERIHRSNLIGMGVLPLQFSDGESADSLGLTGRETYSIDIPRDLTPGQQLEVVASGDGANTSRFTVTARVDTPIEVEYLKNGGILHKVLRKLVRDS
jgi:aconitate hydratase